MTWTAIKTASGADKKISIAEWNEQLKGNLDHIGGTGGKVGAANPCVLAFNAGNQSINSASPTVLAADSESYDTDTMHDASTNNERITITTAGKYHLTAQVAWASAAGTYRTIYIKDKNGIVVGQSQIGPASGVETHHECSARVNAAAADWFAVTVAQDSGGAVNVLGSVVNTWFAAERIG
jgi:hypothetical protein